jgi:ubiquitin conjugation factor E4 B
MVYYLLTKMDSAGPTPNFISDIFFLTCAVGHVGVHQSINRYENSLKEYDDISQHLEQIEGDNSWRGVRCFPYIRDSQFPDQRMLQTPLQARAEAAIARIKDERSKIGSSQFAFRTVLEDPEFVFRSLNFANFVATWILRSVDPLHKHPEPTLE